MLSQEQLDALMDENKYVEDVAQAAYRKGIEDAAEKAKEFAKPCEGVGADLVNDAINSIKALLDE